MRVHQAVTNVILNQGALGPAHGFCDDMQLLCDVAHDSHSHSRRLFASSGSISNVNT